MLRIDPRRELTTRSWFPSGIERLGTWHLGARTHGMAQGIEHGQVDIATLGQFRWAPHRDPQFDGSTRVAELASVWSSPPGPARSVLRGHSALQGLDHGSVDIGTTVESLWRRSQLLFAVGARRWRVPNQITCRIAFQERLASSLRNVESVEASPISTKTFVEFSAGRRKSVHEIALSPRHPCRACRRGPGRRSIANRLAVPSIRSAGTRFHRH